LIARRRINATSVMVAAPSFHRSEAVALNLIDGGKKRAVGLHVTLTAPFRPLSEGFKPLKNGAFLPLGALLVHALLHRLDRAALNREIAGQLRMFIHSFGRPPDFIDGHQHVQLFPIVRDALFDAVQALAPDAWVRQCGRPGPLKKRLRDRKGLVLDALSEGFRKRAALRGVPTNPAFAGTYSFNDSADFAALFPRFLGGLPDHSVVMCHPGMVDAELRRLDPLTTQREKEYAYFADDAFPKLLAAQGVALA
jgi:hypothetical protein